MPVANYAPLAGKYGRVKSNGNTMNLDAHEIRAAADDIDTSHFESDTSVGQATPPVGFENVFTEGLVGMVTGDIRASGSYDSRNNPLVSPFYLWPGNYGTVFLGLTKTYGFSSGYRCLASPVVTNSKSKATFEANLKSNGLITPPQSSL